MIEYWHWLIAGLLLIASEAVAASFVLFWLGLGALLTSCVLYFIPALNIASQIGTWALACMLFLALWFVVIRPRLRQAQHSETIIGHIGIVIQAPIAEQPGVVRFSQPIRGEELWPFTTTDNPRNGERVMILAEHNGTLKVSTQTSQSPRPEAAKTDNTNNT